MAFRKPSQRWLRALRAEAGPGDGIDPRDDARGRGSGRVKNRKTRQLGRQVAETVGQALADSNDDVLRDLYVFSADPAPDASRFVVTVSALPSERADPVDVLERLNAASSRIRAEVAGAITRKRAPLLVFHFAIPVRPGGEDSPSA